MIRTPDEVTETPGSQADMKADLLSDLLSRVRLSGAVFLRGEYSAPWALDSPEHHELVGLLAPGAERLILFHVLRAGRARISAMGKEVMMEVGDLTILPHASQHFMGSIEAGDPVSIASLLPAPPWEEIPVCRFDGGGEPASMVCGYFRCDDLLFNTLLKRLPPVFRVRPSAGQAANWIEASVGYALEQSPTRRIGSATLLSRLPELLLVEALRLYSEEQAASTGWLAAIGDPVVGRALALLHTAPAFDWTADELARQAATSRSVLGERFRIMLDQSPMHYLTEWRMQLAADLLCTTQMKMAAIAEEIGYGSEAAFSRAFSRHVGASPVRWRERVRPG